MAAPGRTGATAEFFDELGRRGYEPLLRKAKGSVRFDLVDGKRIDRRLVTIDKGNITVSRRNLAADCVIRADEALFGRVAAGELNAVAAVMRGELAVGGDWRLVVLIQRLFPGPKKARTRRRAAGYAKRRS
jgi:putative sterol carrier protein